MIASRVTWEMGLWGQGLDYTVVVEDPTAVDVPMPGWDADLPTQREVCSSMLSFSSLTSDKTLISAPPHQTD